MKHLLKTSLMAFAIMTGASLSYAAHGGDEARLNTRRLHTSAEAHDFAELLKQVRAPGLSRIAAPEWLRTHGYAFNAAKFTEQKGIWTTLSSGFRAGTVTLDDLLRTIGVSEVGAAYGHTAVTDDTAWQRREAEEAARQEQARRAQAQAEADCQRRERDEAARQAQADAARQRREAEEAARQEQADAAAAAPSEARGGGHLSPEDRAILDAYTDGVRKTIKTEPDPNMPGAQRRVEVNEYLVEAVSDLSQKGMAQLFKLIKPQVVNGQNVEYVVVHPDRLQKTGFGNRKVAFVGDPNLRLKAFEGLLTRIPTRTHGKDADEIIAGLTGFDRFREGAFLSAEQRLIPNMPNVVRAQFSADNEIVSTNVGMATWIKLD